MLQTLKGFRDFLPPEARKRNFVTGKLRQTFESFGFEPLETPTLEYEEILNNKYGEEGQKLMYKFQDQGQRNVAMRYDQTVPLARVVAQYANDLPLPFKRYQIQNVWRAENTQKGRFREFLQCDIDIVGTTNTFAEAQVIAAITKGLQNLGVENFKVLINDRAIFSNLEVADSERGKIIRSIDKLKKVGRDEVLLELETLGMPKENAEKILGGVENAEETAAIDRVLIYLRELGIDERFFSFSPTLARGLDYYTGIIFEVEIDGYLAGSIAGGGRYDNLIGSFGREQVPAVGGAFGFDRLVEALDQLNLFPKDLTTSQVLVTISNESQTISLRTALELQDRGINIDLYSDPSVGVDKQLKYADRKKIPFVILFEEEKVFIKDMNQGVKTETSVDQIASKVK